MTTATQTKVEPINAKWDQPTLESNIRTTYLYGADPYKNNVIFVNSPFPYIVTKRIIADVIEQCNESIH